MGMKVVRLSGCPERVNRMAEKTKKKTRKKRELKPVLERVFGGLGTKRLVVALCLILVPF